MNCSLCLGNLKIHDKDFVETEFKHYGAMFRTAANQSLDADN
jgi:hypothetical protein